MPRVLSPAAFARLTAELDELRTAGRRDAEEILAAARGAGDIAENPDVHLALADRARLEERIAHLEALLAGAVVADGPVRTDTVGEGCVVTVRYAGDTEVERYYVGSIEERPGDLGVLTPASPLGAALLGARVGDTVSYAAPAGVLCVDVVAIDAP